MCRRACACGAPSRQRERGNRQKRRFEHHVPHERSGESEEHDHRDSDADRDRAAGLYEYAREAEEGSEDSEEEQRPYGTTAPGLPGRESPLYATRTRGDLASREPSVRDNQRD
jgi:hypothetical protein